MGGASHEREVSLSTGKMILGALDPLRYEACGMDMDAFLEQAATWAASPTGSGSALQGDRPDIVFIALHGRGGEDGTIQGMLEILRIPYTGSGVLASALAMDKTMSKNLFRANDIPVAEEVVVREEDLAQVEELMSRVEKTTGFPVFVKPNAEGSSYGSGLARNAAELLSTLRTALRYDSLVLIERYLKGDEITVSVLEEAGNGRALPVIQIVPQSEFYDYESKYAEGGSVHIIPANLSVEQTRRAQDLALHCHKLLGCRGMSRTDLIVMDGAMFVLEVNTIPGMTPTSLLPQAAEHAGIPFSNLLDRILASGLGRKNAH